MPTKLINVDVSVDTLRTRLRQGKIYGIEKIEQSLNNFFRKSNLSVLRELTLRQIADEQAAQTSDYYEMSGKQLPSIPEKVMVCLASRGSSKKILRMGARIAGRLATDWFIVYVETPEESPERIAPETAAVLREAVEFGKNLGGKFVHLKGKNVADELIKYRPRTFHHSRYFRTIGSNTLADFLERFGHQPLSRRGQRCFGSRYSD